MIDGPVYPVVVAFNNNENVDYDSTKAYINYILDNGGCNIMVASATGRFAHLSNDEINQINRITVETTLNGGGIPIASTPINGCTKSHIDTAKRAQDYGANIVICEYPWRYQGSQALVKYFSDICTSTDMSVMLHVTPSRSEIATTFGKTHRYEVDDLVDICSLPNVVGFKEASGDKEHSLKIWEALGGKTDIIVAGEASETFLRALKYGINGFFTGIESIFPSLGIRVYNLILDNKVEEVQKLVSSFSELLHTCKDYGWHASLKYCLYKLNLMSLQERSPMCPITPEQRKVLDLHLLKVSEIYPND